MIAFQQVLHQFVSGKRYIVQLDFTHAKKQIHYSRHIVLNNYALLDNSTRILFHLQEDFHQLLSGKRYIAKQDSAHAKKKIHCCRHIVLSNYAILDDSARI